MNAVSSDFATKLKKALVEAGYEFREIPSEGELDSFYEQYRGNSSSELVKHWVENNPSLPAKLAVDRALGFLNWFYKNASKTSLEYSSKMGIRKESKQYGMPTTIIGDLEHLRIIRRIGHKAATKIQWVGKVPTRDTAYRLVKYLNQKTKTTSRTSVHLRQEHKSRIEDLLKQGKTPDVIVAKHLKEFGGLPETSVLRYAKKVLKEKGQTAKFALPLPKRADEKEELVSKVAKEIVAETELGKRGREIEMGKWVETEPTMKRTKPPKAVEEIEEKVVIDHAHTEIVNEEKATTTEEEISANETNLPIPPDFGSEYLLKLIERQAELIEMQSEFLQYQRKFILKAIKKRTK